MAGQVNIAKKLEEVEKKIADVEEELKDAEADQMKLPRNTRTIPLEEKADVQREFDRLQKKIDRLIGKEKQLNDQKTTLLAKLPDAPTAAVDAVAAGMKKMSVEDIVNDLPASSGYSKVSPKQHELLQNHRGAAERAGWNHASLYSQSLRNFVYNIKERLYESEDLAFASEYAMAFLEKELLDGEDVKKLMNTFLGVGGAIEKRQVKGLLGKHAGPRAIQRGGGKEDVRSDVTVEIVVKVEDQDFLIAAVLGEAKGKTGSFDLANGQNQLYHVFLCYEPVDPVKEIRNKTCCPIIFIEQEGPVLCVSIGAFIGRKFLKDHVACTKLECSTFNEAHMVEQASIWHAIRKAVLELQAEYQKLFTERKDVAFDDNNDKVLIDGQWIRVRSLLRISVELSLT